MPASYFSREWCLPLGNRTVFLPRDEPPFWFPWEGGLTSPEWSQSFLSCRGQSAGNLQFVMKITTGRIHASRENQRTREVRVATQIISSSRLAREFCSLIIRDYSQSLPQKILPNSHLTNEPDEPHFVRINEELLTNLRQGKKLGSFLL